MKKSILLITLFAACAAGPQNKPLPGYDLAQPIVYKMPSELEEISGIAFQPGKDDLLYAEQDEEGKVFYFHPGDTDIPHIKFGKKGDFEDLAVSHGIITMLRSDGVFFTFPLDNTGQKDAGNVQEQDGLLPGGEYESLFADEAGSRLYVLCKNCKGDKKTTRENGYVFAQAPDGTIKPQSTFTVDEAAIAKLAGKSEFRLKASGFARHPKTGQWYILSAVNHMLVITDNNWKPLGVYPLDGHLFTQPEGIAFDTAGNLYIANERGNGSTGTVLRFAFRQR